VNTSLTSKTRKPLISIKTKIEKDKRLSYGRDTTDGTKDGELSIKTSTPRLEERDTARDSVSTSIDHSTLDQECH
jgi:hypothetical protein